MEKAKKAILMFFAVVIILVLALYGFYWNLSGRVIDTPNNNVLYYGITCPHCKIVEEFMANNNITQKIQIELKEVYKNETNSKELVNVAKSLDMNTDQIGVPFLYYEGKAYIGDVDIIDLLKKEANIA